MCAPTGDITGGSIVGVAEKVGEGPGGAARPGRRLGCRNLQGAEMGAGSRGGARPLLVLRPPLPASPAAAATTQEHSEQEQAAQRADLRGWCRSAPQSGLGSRELLGQYIAVKYYSISIYCIFL